MEKKVEVKNKQKFLLGFLIGAFFVLNGIVFGAYLFSDTQSSLTEIIGTNPNQTINITGTFLSSVIINSNSSSDITLSEEKTYTLMGNKTFIFTPNVQTTLLDSSCLNYLSDCSMKWYMKDDPVIIGTTHTFYFNETSYFTNPFVMGKGANKIGYELVCKPNSCHQILNKSYTLSE